MANGTARKRLPPEERRAQLLECALEVFARRGFGRAGHAEIAEAAGVAVSTVFLYFETRAELIRAVLEEVGSFYRNLALRIHAQEKPCRDVMTEHRRAFLESVDSHPHHARIALDWSTAVREEVWPQYLSFLDELVANHVRTIRRGQAGGEVPQHVDPETCARMLIGTAQLTAQMKLTGTNADMLERMSSLMIDAALGGPSSADSLAANI